MRRRDLPRTLVWVEEAYDREMASDGVSRYAGYLRRSRLLTGGESLTGTEFAVEAWHLACSPVMSPGYVTWHPRIRLVYCRGTDGGFGGVLAVVELPLAWPSGLAGAAGLSGWRDWDVRCSPAGDTDSWYRPAEDRPGLLCIAQLQVPVPAIDLPTTDCPGPDVRAAKAAVAAIVDRINATCTGVVGDLLCGWGRGR